MLSKEMKLVMDKRAVECSLRAMTVQLFYFLGGKINAF